MNAINQSTADPPEMALLFAPIDDEVIFLYEQKRVPLKRFAKTPRKIRKIATRKSRRLDICPPGFIRFDSIIRNTNKEGAASWHWSRRGEYWHDDNGIKLGDETLETFKWAKDKVLVRPNGWEPPMGLCWDKTEKAYIGYDELRWLRLKKITVLEMLDEPDTPVSIDRNYWGLR
jgi:hypothetical protein